MMLSFEEFEEICGICEKMEEYTDLMNDEYGDNICALMSMFRHCERCTDKFKKSLYNEIRLTYKDLQENFIIVTEEKEVTRTVTQQVVYSIYDEEYHEYKENQDVNRPE
jgi:ethanolamine ammonia-lyase large subunit